MSFALVVFVAPFSGRRGVPGGQVSFALVVLAAPFSGRRGVLEGALEGMVPWCWPKQG